MKKWISMMIMILMITGCHKQADILSKEQSYSYNEQVEIEIMKTEVLTELNPSNQNAQNETITPENDNVIIDIVVKAKNISTKQIEFKSIFSGQLRIDGVSYKLASTMESANYLHFTTTDTIKIDEDRIVHLYSEVPETVINEEMTMNLTILDEQDVTYTFTVEKENTEDSHKKSIGDVLLLNNCEITLGEIKRADQVEPSTKGLFYTFIPTDNENQTFIILMTEIKNKTSDNLDLQDYMNCEYLVDGQTFYSKVILETENHKSLRQSGSIEALQTRTVYFAIAVDNEYLNKNGYIKLFVEGETYQIY